MIEKDDCDEDANHLITCATFLKSREVIETLHCRVFPVANVIEIQLWYKTMLYDTPVHPSQSYNGIIS